MLPKLSPGDFLSAIKKVRKGSSKSLRMNGRSIVVPAAITYYVKKVDGSTVVLSAGLITNAVTTSIDPMAPFMWPQPRKALHYWLFHRQSRFFVCTICQESCWKFLGSHHRGWPF